MAEDLIGDNLSFCYYLKNVIGIFYYTILAILQTIFPFLLKKKSVHNKIILITGGGGGIGQLMAIKFAKLGAIIVIWDINETLLNKTKKIISNLNAKCYSYVVDVSNREKIYEAAQQLKKDVGPVYMLINNAGIVSGKYFLEIKDEDIVRCMDVNINAHFWTLKSFLPEMIARNEGHIVSIASIAGTIGVTKLTDYCASKFAALGFEEALRVELVTTGYEKIKSTVICPWYIDTGMFTGAKSLIPLLEPEYVADKIVNAVLTDQQVLFIPRTMYVTNILKAILPTNAAKCCMYILNAHRSMNHFVGRKKD